MPLSSKRLLKPFRKLRNALRAASKRASPARIHELRIQVRRVEAIVHTFLPYLKHDGERLIQGLEPIRKKAGRVRDLDVLTEIVSNLGIEEESPCIAKLLVHLSAERIRWARKLHEAIDEQRSRACRRLRVVFASLEEYISVSNRRHRDVDRVEVNAVTLRLLRELVVWPRLKADNLHAFRRKVRELINNLQFITGNSAEFIGALRNVKDSIGDWHDWTILGARADELIGVDSQCKVPRVIRQTAAAKLNHALSTSRAMREKYLTEDSRYRGTARREKHGTFSFSPPRNGPLSQDR